MGKRGFCCPDVTGCHVGGPWEVGVSVHLFFVFTFYERVIISER